jgi:hypothetical protein
MYHAFSMPPLVVQLLSERSPAELEETRERLQADLSRTTVELEQVEAAIKLQRGRASRSARPHASGQRGKSGRTRKRVLAVIGASKHPIGVAAIKRAMEAEGGFVPQAGSLYSTVKRLTEQGVLHKVGDGEYTLPDKTASVNGHGGPFTGNKTGAMDSTTAV